MVKERDLKQWEKDFIRDEIKDAVARDATAEELAKIRAALTDLLEVQPRQVQSTGAWKRKPGQEKYVLEKTPTSEDSNNETPQVEVVNENSVIDDDVKEEREESTGAHMDYNFAEKIEWRNRWKEFIDEHTPQEKRASMKVLCLPGKQCLEIPLYLELGFTPENIVGFECEDSAREEFFTNAKKYGIDARFGNMKKLLPKDEIRYDVVNLDFHGQFSNTQIKILEHLLLADEAVVSFNQMAKREKEDAQRFLSITKHRYLDDIEINDDTWKQFNKTQDSRAQSPISETRDCSVAQACLIFLGKKRIENIKPGRYGYLKSQEDAEDAVQAAFDIRQILQDLFAWIVPSANKEQCIQLAARAKEMFDNGLQRVPYVTDIKQLRYSSKKGTPFNSSFLALNVSRKELDSIRHSIDFLAHCVAERLKALQSGSADKGRFEIWDSKMRSKLDLFMFTKSLNIVYRLNDQVVDNIRASKFLHDLEIMEGIYQNQIWKKQFLEREVINLDQSDA